MHIMEGYLPIEWVILWTAIALPIVGYGVYRLSKVAKEHPEAKPLIALMGAFIFILSALKLPSVTGSSSHPTGSGLAAIIFGPGVASVLSMIVLIFQALLLAHGGLTTLGANTFSMGIIGPAIAFAVWVIGKKARLSTSVTVFIAVALSDLGTYVVTAAQLALAQPIAGTFFESFTYFGAIYAVTQVPLAIGEAILAVLLFDFLVKYKGNLLSSLKVIKPAGLSTEKEVNPP